MGNPRGGETANDTGFDAVIVATGGLVGAGIVLDGGLEPSGPPGFRSSVDADLQIGRDGRLLDHVSSIHGMTLGRAGMRGLEHIGILAEGPVARGGSSLLVAGDCVADRPRTALSAVRQGIAAARRALSR